MRWSTAGYMWTTSTAGWVVLAYMTRLPEAVIVAVGCGAMAAACIWISNSE